MAEKDNERMSSYDLSGTMRDSAAAREQNRQYRETMGDTRFDEKTSKEKALEKFGKSVRAEQQSLIDFTANAKAIVDKANKGRLTPEAQMRQQIFERRLALTCLAPLQNGLSGESLLTAGSMFLGMYLASPSIRKQVHQFRADRYSKKLDNLVENGGDRFGSAGKHYAKKRDKFLRKAHDGRVPMTDETAALFDLGLQKRAYMDMRGASTDAEKDAIMDQFKEARSALFEVADYDGVDINGIAEQERIIVGKMMSDDPEFAEMFSETTYGGATKDMPHATRYVRYDEKGRPSMETGYQWTGEFSNPDGTRFDGMFTPRRAMSKEDLINTFADIESDAMDKSMEYVKNGDLRHFENVSRMAGNVVRKMGCMPGEPQRPHMMDDMSIESGVHNGMGVAAKRAMSDGVSDFEVYQASVAGNAMAQSRTLTKVSCETLGADGMEISQKAMAYAKVTYGGAWSPEGGEEGRSYMGDAIECRDRYVDAMLKDMSLAGSRTPAEMEELRRSASMMIDTYQKEIAECTAVGMTSDDAIEHVSRMQLDACNEWAGEDPKRQALVSDCGEESYRAVNRAVEDSPQFAQLVVRSDATGQYMTSHAYENWSSAMNRQSHEASSSYEASSEHKTGTWSYADQAEAKFGDIGAGPDQHDGFQM